MVAHHSEQADLELLGPPCPDALVYLWEWFVELTCARTGNGFGANPMTWTEIYLWSRIHGRWLQPFEREAIRALDHKFLQVMAPVKK